MINSEASLRMRNKGKVFIRIGLGLMILLGLYIASLQLLDARHMRNIFMVTQDRRLQTPRGTIYDRNGNPLAMSIETESFYVDPVMLRTGDPDHDVPARTPEEAAALLSKVMNVPEEELVKIFSRKDTSFEWIRRNMDLEDAKKIEAVLEKNNIQAIRKLPESKRYYPNGALLAQVLGGVSEMTPDEEEAYREENGKDPVAGLDGLEYVLDSRIKQTTEDLEVIAVDKDGRAILNGVWTKFLPDKAGSVTLTIDTTVQFIAERALDKAMVETKAAHASVIVMDPQTGEILAMANRPNYDPSDLSKASPEAIRNTAVTSLYEPGSTFKPIIASAALASNSWSLDRVYDDKGSIVVSGHTMRNWNGEGYGPVKLLDILKYSINTGMARIGLATGAQTLTDYVKAYGFGRQTGIEIPGEGEGILFKDPKTMVDSDVATMSIGQSIAVTPLQMVQAFGAIANGGKMMKPHIIKSFNNPDGSVAEVAKDVEQGQPIPKNIAEQISNILEKEVSEGGGQKAHIEGYHFGGKTGTAEKINPNGGGYLAGRYIASFIGFGPIEEPKFVVLVVIDDPEGTFYGGQIAAPVFKDIMSQLVRYYHISPTVTVVHPEDADTAKEKALAAQAEAEKARMRSVVKTTSGAVVVPDFTGWTYGEVRNWLGEAGLAFKPVGTGNAIGQSVAPGEAVPMDSAVEVHFTR